MNAAASRSGDEKYPQPVRKSVSVLVPLTCLVLSALAVLPFFFMGEPADGGSRLRLRMPLTHDMILHYDQMRSFHAGLVSGEVYPRWEEDTNRGFGAPTSSYYPPGVYYLTSALYAISRDWLVALLILLLAMMAASAAAIYFYARSVMSRAAAIAAMVAYIFLPYHIVDQYQRGAIAELLGFTFMPLMLLFGERLLLDRQRVASISESGSMQQETAAARELPRYLPQSVPGNIAGLAITFGAFLWSHPPTAYQFSLFFLIFVTLFALIHRSGKRLLLVGLGMALGSGLAAAYVYPALVEVGLIRREFITITWPYHNTYVFAAGVPYNMIDFAWVFNTLAILVAAAILLVVERHLVKPSERLRHRIWLWALLGGLASFMMTKLSYPVGRMIPKIEAGVFAWRMLGFTTLIAALLAGACVQAAINAVKQQRGVRSNSLASLVSFAIVGGALFTVVILWPAVYRTSGFSTAEEHVNVPMMPVTGPREPLELPRVERAELAAGQGQIDVERWDPEHRTLKVELRASDRLLIRTFNFPGWRAAVNGEPVSITSGEALRVNLGDSEEALIRAATFRGGTPVVDGRPGSIIGKEPLGDIVIDLPTGNQLVTLDYLDTAARRLGELINVFSLILVLGLLLASAVMKFIRRRPELESN